MSQIKYKLTHIPKIRRTYANIVASSSGVSAIAHTTRSGRRVRGVVCGGLTLTAVSIRACSIGGATFTLCKEKRNKRNTYMRKRKKKIRKQDIRVAVYAVCMEGAIDLGLKGDRWFHRAVCVCVCVRVRVCIVVAY